MNMKTIPTFVIYSIHSFQSFKALEINTYSIEGDKVGNKGKDDIAGGPSGIASHTGTENPYPVPPHTALRCEKVILRVHFAPTSHQTSDFSPVDLCNNTSQSS
jgi:hypothetical protein